MEEDFDMGGGMGDLAAQDSYLPSDAPMDMASAADANSFVDDNVSKTNLPQEAFVPAPANGATDFSAQSKPAGDSTMLPPVTVTAPPPAKGVVVPSATSAPAAAPSPPPAAAAPPAAPVTGDKRFTPEVNDALNKASEAYGIPVETLRAFTHIESGGNARSNEGKKTQYKGLMQLGTEEWNKHGGGGDPYNPYDAAMAGASLMAENSRRFEAKMGARADGR